MISFFFTSSNYIMLCIINAYDLSNIIYVQKIQSIVVYRKTKIFTFNTKINIMRKTKTITKVIYRH